MLSAEAFARAHEPAARAAEIVREWEAEAARVVGELEEGHRDLARLVARSRTSEEREGGKEDEWVNDEEPEGLRLELSCAEEMDELFEALEKNVRLAADS